MLLVSSHGTVALLDNLGHFCDVDEWREDDDWELKPDPKPQRRKQQTETLFLSISLSTSCLFLYVIAFDPVVVHCLYSCMCTLLQSTSYIQYP